MWTMYAATEALAACLPCLPSPTGLHGLTEPLFNRIAKPNFRTITYTDSQRFLKILTERHPDHQKTIHAELNGVIEELFKELGDGARCSLEEWKRLDSFETFSRKPVNISLLRGLVIAFVDEDERTGVCNQSMHACHHSRLSHPLSSCVLTCRLDRFLDCWQ